MTVEVLIDTKNLRPVDTTLSTDHQNSGFEESPALECVERALRKTLRGFEGSRDDVPDFLTFSS